MNIRMIGKVSGVRDGKSWPDAGETLDVPDDEAAALCASGLAEPVDARNAETETATKPEAAVTKRGSKGMTKD